MHTSFDKERWDAFNTLRSEGPIHMLNLVRFREWAEYEDGARMSGAEAYKNYSRLSAPVFARLGGRIVWRGNPQIMMIGPQEEAWDIAFIAQYPTSDAFVNMIKDPDYRKAMPHRQAAVLDSRLLRLDPKEGGKGF